MTDNNASMKSVPILSLSHLTVDLIDGQNKKPLVNDVSFDIALGETLALIGESGSGKSMTAQAIMRLLPRDRIHIGGRVMFDGTDLVTLTEPQMRQVRGKSIGMIFQEPMSSLNPVIQVGRQIAEVVSLHSTISREGAKAEAIRLMDRVRIPESRRRYDDYPYEFSGGMRQRLMIAMALACRPRLIIADEPTTALDVTVQARILRLLDEIQKEDGMAMLLITHDIGVVAGIADRTAVMHQGRLLEAGPTEQIFRHPQAAYTRRLLAAVPRLGSLQGHDLPVAFPEIDARTGEVGPVPPAVDTVIDEELPLLDVRNLNVRFDIRSGALRRVFSQVHAVQQVSFTLKRGETLSIVGESGSGKSTLSRCLVRIQKESAGEILLSGLPLTGIGRKELRERRLGIQMIFQDPAASLNPRLTVGASISGPLIVNGSMDKKAAWTRAEELLEQVGLSASMASRFPHEFSGGQRQRICIARALAPRPSIIVADEAVSALDASIKTQILNLMMDLQQRYNLSFVFVSHDMSVVERVSHRVAVMYRGEIVEMGSRASIFYDPQHPYTKRLLASVPVPEPGNRSFMNDPEIPDSKSIVKPKGWEGPPRTYRQVGQDHFVLEEVA